MKKVVDSHIVVMKSEGLTDEQMSDVAWMTYKVADMLKEEKVDGWEFLQS
jgi:hypothetical protein